jgi:H/ACA ribonucleoprotein complex subunit 4
MLDKYGKLTEKTPNEWRSSYVDLTGKQGIQAETILKQASGGGAGKIYEGIEKEKENVTELATSSSSTQNESGEKKKNKNKKDKDNQIGKTENKDGIAEEISSVKKKKKREKSVGKEDDNKSEKESDKKPAKEKSEKKLKLDD